MTTPRRRKRIEDTQQGGIAGHLVGLSLFVMMLAFFIILNSISTFDETKVKPLTENLEQTFAANIAPGVKLSPSLVPSPEKGFCDGDVLGKVQGLFKSQIQSTETAVSSQRGIMYMRLPTKDFERIVAAMGNTQSTPQEGSFLMTLGSLLRAEARGTPFSMDVVYNLEENPAHIANQDPIKMAAIVKSVSSTVNKIELAGLPARLMTIGLQKGDPAFVDITFARHYPPKEAEAKNE